MIGPATPRRPGEDATHGRFDLASVHRLGPRGIERDARAGTGAPAPGLLLAGGSPGGSRPAFGRAGGRSVRFERRRRAGTVCHDGRPALQPADGLRAQQSFSRRRVGIQPQLRRPRLSSAPRHGAGAEQRSARTGRDNGVCPGRAPDGGSYAGPPRLQRSAPSDIFPPGQSHGPNDRDRRPPAGIRDGRPSAAGHSVHHVLTWRPFWAGGVLRSHRVRPGLMPP
jgi:hypothetical protein